MSAPIFEMGIETEKIIGITLTLLCFIAGSIIFTIADVIAERREVELVFSFELDWIQFLNRVLMVLPLH
jgi:uncharacterized protein involved in cysteine biosynthesis